MMLATETVLLNRIPNEKCTEILVLLTTSYAKMLFLSSSLFPSKRYLQFFVSGY